MKTHRNAMKNTRRLSICATSIAAFMAASPESPGVPFIVNLGDTQTPGAVGGATGLDKSGGGSLILGAGNTYTGTTTISNGSIVINATSGLGTDPSTVIVTGFNPSANSTNSRGFGGGSLVLDGTTAGFNLTRNLSLQGQGPIADRGGALISIGNNTVSGTVGLAPAAANGSTVGINTRLLSASGLLTFGGSFDINGLSGPAANVATIGVLLGGTNQAGSGQYAITGALTGTGTLEKTGAGTLFLNPSSSAGFSGALRLSGQSSTGTTSTVRITNGGSVLGTRTASGLGSVIDANGGFLEVLMDAPSLLVGTAAAHVYVRANTTTIFADRSLGGSAINQTLQLGNLNMDNATLQVSGRDGYNTTINGLTGPGTSTTLGGAGNAGFNNTGNGLFTFNGNLSNTTTTARTFVIGGNGDILITGNYISPSTAAAAHQIDKRGTGYLTILGTAGTYTGTTEVQQGTLSVSSIGALGVPGTAATNFQIGGQGAANVVAATVTGALEYTGGAATTARGITFRGTTGGANVISSGSGPLTFTGNFLSASTGSKTLTLGGSNGGDNTIAGNIPDASTLGAISVTKIGGGTWRLSGANTNTGTTLVTAGTLKVQDAFAGTSRNVLSDAATSTVAFGVDLYTNNAGGTLEYLGDGANASTETAGTLRPVAGAGTVKVTAGAGGTAALTFAALGQAASGSGVNFVTNAGASVALTGAVNTSGILDAHLYSNGADFAAGTSAAPATYTTEAAGTSLAGLNTQPYLVNTTDIAAQSSATINAGIKFNDNRNLTLAAAQTLTLNNGGALAGGILVTGGSNVVISGGTGINSGSITTDLVFRTNSAADTLTLNTPILVNTGGWTKLGEGTLRFGAANANTASAAVHINEGTVQLITGGRLGQDSTDVNLRQGATLDLNGVNLGTATSGTASLDELNGGGTVTNSSTTAVSIRVGNGGANSYFTGSIVDPAGNIQLVKNGAGTFRLAGAQSYSGGARLNTGTLAITSLSNIGSNSGLGVGLGTSDVDNAASLVFGGGTLSYTGSDGTIYQTTGTPSVSTDRLFTLAANGRIDSNGRYGAPNRESNANNAALVFNKTNAVSFSGSGARTLTLGGDSTGDNQLNLQLINNPNAGEALTFDKQNAGLWILGNNSNSHSGPTVISGGALRAEEGLSLPTSSALRLNGGVLQTSGTFIRAIGSAAGQVAWNNAAGTSVNSSGGFAASSAKLTVNLGNSGASIPWGAGGITSTGTANLILSSTTSQADVELVNGLTLNGGTRTVQVDDNANTGADFATISGVISDGSGPSSLNKAGGGILQLTNNGNSYTGTTTIAAGTLTVRSLGNSGSPGNTSVGNSTIGNTDAGAVNLGTAILQYVGPGETSDRKIRFSVAAGTPQIHADGAGALILSNVANDVPAGTGAKTLNLRGTNAAGNRITSTLTDNANPGGGALTVTVDGSATWIMQGANSYTGNTNAAGGALGIDAGASPLGAGNFVMNNGIVFAYGADRTVTNNPQFANNQTTGFIGENSLSFGTLQNLAAANNVGINNNIAAGDSLTFAGITSNVLTANRVLTVDGSGLTIINGNITSTTAFGVPITKTGYGTLQLNGAASDFSKGNATFDIDNGVVILGANNAIPNSTGAGALTFSPDVGTNETATLQLNGFSQTLNALTVTGANTAATTIDNNSGSAVTLSFGNNNGAVNFNGTVSNTGGGALSLVKAGTATGTFSGSAITYSGTTTVSGGNLAFTVSDPVNTNGFVVAGGSGLSMINGIGTPHTSTIAGGLNLGAGPGITGLGLDLGTSSDAITSTTPAITAGTVNFSIGAAAGFGAPTYTLLSAPSGLDGATYGLVGPVPGGYTYSLSSSASSVVLTTSAVTPGGVYNFTGDLNNSFSGYVGGVAANTNFEVGGTDPGSIPGPGDFVEFNSAIATPAGPTVNVTLDAPVSVQKFTFNGNVTSTALANVVVAAGTGGTLTLGTGGIEIMTDGGTATISAPVATPVNMPISVADVGTATGLTISGIMSGAGDITKTGAGTATLSGVNTRTGKTAIDNGVLRIGAETGLGANPSSSAADALSINNNGTGGTATLRSTGVLTIDDANRGITIGTNGGSIDTLGGNITIANAVTGGALRKEGGNTLILNNASNNYASTFVNVGAVRAGANTALGAGATTLGNTGTILEVADGISVGNAITVADAGNEKTIRLLAGASSGTVSGPITVEETGGGGNFRLQASGTGILTISGAIANGAGTVARGLRVNEAGGNTGVVVLSGPNTYTGNTEVRQGTLRNGANEVIGGSVTLNAAVAASPTATYDLAGNNETVSALTYGATGSSNAAYTNNVTTNGGTLTLAGTVTTVASTSSAAANLSGLVAMTAVRTFNVADATNNAADLLVSAAISGTGGGINKTGAGTLVLSGASNYTGATTVTAGTLLVTGSITGAVTTAGGTLGGTGSVGAITATTGTVAPGASIGTLTAGSLTMSGATFALEINSTANTTDLLSTTGPLTLALGGTPLTVSDLAPTPLALGTKFTFITYSGLQQGLFSVSGFGTIADDIGTFIAGGNQYTIDYNDLGGTAVSLVVVPEPGIAASLLGGFGMLVGLQRIRRRSDRRA